MKRVAIIGTGPTGLMAGLAADLLGYSVWFYGSPERERVTPSAYMLAPIPSPVPTVSRTLKRMLYAGTELSWKAKMYGPAQHLPAVRDEKMLFGAKASIWSVAEAYDLLWNYFALDTDLMLTPGFVTEEMLPTMIGSYDRVLTTIDARQLCKSRLHEGGSHHFLSLPLFLAASERPMFGVPDDTVWYNGDPVPSWARAARIFGETVVEWYGDGKRPPYEGLIEIEKPLRTNCDCWPEVVRIGRRSQWTKSPVPVPSPFSQAHQVLRRDA